MKRLTQEHLRQMAEKANVFPFAYVTEAIAIVHQAEQLSI